MNYKISSFLRILARKIINTSSIDIEKQAESMYQFYVDSKEGKQVYKDAITKYPEYNTISAKKATNYIMEHFKSYIINNYTFATEYLRKLLEKLRSKVHAGIT